MPMQLRGFVNDWRGVVHQTETGCMVVNGKNRGDRV